MKLVFKTAGPKKQEKTYLVRLPNYYDTDKVDELLEDIKFELSNKETIVEHHFYGDTALTLDERKQIDIHGEVVNPHTELVLNL